MKRYTDNKRPDISLDPITLRSRLCTIRYSALSLYRMWVTKMCYQSIALFLCIIICSSFASLVKFLPTTSFNLPSNFKDGSLPCSRETVVFPETLLTSVRLEAETFVSGLILPTEGDIILSDGMIVFGPDETDVNCTQEGNVYYLERGAVLWFQPDIWSSSRFNDATPDAERVPCFDDIVEFPSNSEFTLIFPIEVQVIAGIKIGHHICREIEVCIDILTKPNSGKTFIANKFFTSGLSIGNEQCLSKGGCPCQEHPLEIRCKSKYCSVPTCVYPIKPEGHCCKICGGVISFNITKSFDMIMFKELVEKTIESYGIDSLVYHLGRLPNNRVQLVVVDKAEYSGISAEVVNDVNHQMKRHWVQGAKFVDYSGSPLEKSGFGGKIFVSVFFLVVFVMGGIYVYYYKLPEASDVRFPIMNRTTPGVFSRFQSRTDSVVCLTRRDSDVPIERSVGTAFRNPLYDSLKPQEDVEEIQDNE